MNETLGLTLVLLCFSLIFIKVKGIKYSLISPPLMVNLFILLYVLLGFNEYWQGDFYFLNIDFSDTFEKIYPVVSVFTIVFTIVFVLFYYFRLSRFNAGKPVEYDLKVNHVIAYSSIFYIYAILNFNNISIPGLHNFILLFFNSLVVVVGYAFVTKMRFSKTLLLILVLIILYMGFRYRLIFLLLPLIFSVFIFKKITFLKMFTYGAGVLFCVALIALVGVTRKYSSGLQFERLEGYSFYDLIIKGIFNDTSTVFVSGAFINWLDESQEFAYFDQFFYILNYFIPKYFYPDKLYSPLFQHLSNVTLQPNNESGAAVLSFAEYYHTAGYLGVVIFAILFAVIYSKLFKRIQIVGGVYNHYVYFVSLAWLINSFTRGYFPQNVQDLISLLIGFSAIKILSNKRIKE